MEKPFRLTAFEFVSLTDDPQLVRLKRGEMIVSEYVVDGWLWWSMASGIADFEKPSDLIIEGIGIGRPYWNQEPPPWIDRFNPVAEMQRIDQIRRAAFEFRAAGGSLLAMKS